MKSSFLKVIQKGKNDIKIKNSDWQGQFLHGPCSTRAIMLTSFFVDYSFKETDDPKRCALRFFGYLLCVKGSGRRQEVCVSSWYRKECTMRVMACDPKLQELCHYFLPIIVFNAFPNTSEQTMITDLMEYSFF